jgi:hypothetical protein
MNIVHRRMSLVLVRKLLNITAPLRDFKALRLFASPADDNPERFAARALVAKGLTPLGAVLMGAHDNRPSKSLIRSLFVSPRRVHQQLMRINACNTQSRYEAFAQAPARACLQL